MITQNQVNTITLIVIDDDSDIEVMASSVINSQFDCLRWMEDTMDNLWNEFSSLDHEIDRKS